MILRRPFAFFIKHFKMFHFIMLCFMLYIAYISNSVLSFFNEYLNSTMILIDHNVLITLFPKYMYLSILLIFVITFIILGLMVFKRKPIKFYIFNIFSYIFTTIVLISASNMLSGLEISLVEVRTLKLMQDFILMSILLQGISCLFVGIRASGFNIKKFDFAKDLAELNIEEKDSEEFEINLSLETDRYFRKLKKTGRYIKYIYVENKYMLTIIGAFLFAIICIIIYLNQNIYNKTYSENQMLSTNEFYFSVTQSYITNTDYRGNVVDSNYSFVITKIKLKTFSNFDKILSTGKIALNVNDRNIYATTQYKTEFSDLGVYYNEEPINNSFSEYILIFKIPNSYIDDNMKIYFFDNNLKTIAINISPINLEKDFVTKKCIVGDTIAFENSLLKESTILLDSVSIDSKFIVNYNMCLQNNECILSSEVIKPNLNTNYDKVLIRMKGSYKIDESISMNISKPFTIIEKFGSIYYYIDNNEYIIKNLTEVLSNKVSDSSTIYLEAPEDIINADRIDLKIKIRNRIYIYNLKQENILF